MKLIHIIVLISLTTLTLAKSQGYEANKREHNNIPELKEKLENYQKNLNYDKEYESKIVSIIDDFINILNDEQLTEEENRGISLFEVRLGFIVNNISKKNVLEYIDDAQKIIEKHKISRKEDY